MASLLSDSQILLAFMVPESANQASKEMKHPSVLTSYDAYEHQILIVWYNNPKNSVMTHSR